MFLKIIDVLKFFQQSIKENPNKVLLFSNEPYNLIGYGVNVFITGKVIPLNREADLYRLQLTPEYSAVISKGIDKLNAIITQNVMPFGHWSILKYPDNFHPYHPNQISVEYIGDYFIDRKGRFYGNQAPQFNGWLNPIY